MTLVAAGASLMVSVATGAALGAASAGIARNIPDVDRPLFRLDLGSAWRAAPRCLAEPAVVVGALVPVASAVTVDSAGPWLAATIVGWLLLAIAVTDERTLMIPHAFWICGIIAGLAVAWSVAGWSALSARLVAAGTLVVGVRAAARLARAARGRTPIGNGDYGVIAFLGAALGLGVAIDVLLVGSILALCLAAARRRGPEVPFGACLALGVFLVVLGSATPGIPPSRAVRHDLVLHHLLLDRP